MKHLRMKIKHIYILLLLGAFSACFFSCKKDLKEDAFPAQLASSKAKPPYLTIADFLAQNTPVKQNFNFSNAAYKVITCAQGSKLSFWPNTFVTMEDQPYYGNVTIEVLELLEKSDMVLYNKCTQSGGKILQSGGEIFIKAVDLNGKELKVATGMTYRIDLPKNANDNQMKEYYGTEDGDGNLNWTTNNSRSFPVRMDSTTQKEYFSCLTDSLHWINCDHPYYTTEKPLSVTLNGNGITYNNTNTLVWIVLQDKAVLRVYLTGNVANWQYMPDGYNATIVTLTIVNGMMYSSFTPFSTSTTSSLTVTPAVTIDADFKSKLRALN